MKFLHHIVKLNKSLAAKKDKVTMLRYHFDSQVFTHDENPAPTYQIIKTPIPFQGFELRSGEDKKLW